MKENLKKNYKNNNINRQYLVIISDEQQQQKKWRLNFDEIVDSIDL